MAANFFWYELMTTDVPAAEAFYKKVVGWGSEPFPGDMPYTVVKAGERGVGGIMAVPPDAAAMGMRPAWMGYVEAKNVDAATVNARAAGALVHREPEDIPGVGRFAVLSDPHGAMFMLLQPMGPDQPPVAMGTPGHVGWHELYAGDERSAFDFYAGQFGWTRGDSMDMGEMGTYQLYYAGGADMAGGIMNKPDNIPAPTWLFYFNVPDIDAAVKRVTDNGGEIMMPPMEVPGGSWVAQARDPQGAMFAVMAPARQAKPGKAARPARAKAAKPAAPRKPAAKKASAKK